MSMIHANKLGATSREVTTVQAPIVVACKLEANLRENRATTMAQSPYNTHGTAQTYDVVENDIAMMEQSVTGDNHYDAHGEGAAPLTFGVLNGMPSSHVPMVKVIGLYATKATGDNSRANDVTVYSGGVVSTPCNTNDDEDIRAFQDVYVVMPTAGHAATINQISKIDRYESDGRAQRVVPRLKAVTPATLLATLNGMINAVRNDDEPEAQRFERDARLGDHGDADPLANLLALVRGLHRQENNVNGWHPQANGTFMDTVSSHFGPRARNMRQRAALRQNFTANQIDNNDALDLVQGTIRLVLAFQQQRQNRKLGVSMNNAKKGAMSDINLSGANSTA